MHDRREDSGSACMKRVLNPCGECHHVGYEDIISEWFCKKHKRLLGYSLQPYKCPQCSIIGTCGDMKEMRAMFAFIMGPA
jgi:hypothetical protein